MSTSGTALVEFNDFMLGTSSAFVSGPRQLVNDAVKNTYWWGRFIDGSLDHKTVRGGTDIREKLTLRHGNVSRNYKPGAFHTWQNPQVSIQAKVDWRFSISHLSWTDAEIINNEAIKYGDRGVRFMQFTDLAEQKESVMWTDFWEFLDLALFSVPDKDEMESANGLDQMSLFAMINEFADGLFQRGPGGTWTTKEGIDPTTSNNAKWNHQLTRYASSAVNDVNGIFAAFDEMMHLTHFERPATHKQYWEDPSMRKRVILTTKYGRKAVMNLLRQAQDHFVAGPQDPAYDDPQFHGIQIAWADPLDTSAVYPDTGSGLVSELNVGATHVGPRFYWWDANHMCPVINDERYFYKDKPSRHHNVPDTWVQPCLVWWNLFTTSLMRQGLVAPSGDPFSIIP